MCLSYRPTIVQEIDHPIARDSQVRVLVKREDQNHPYVSGNKWWKLKYNLAEAKTQGKQALLTFGGAYSNHIFATAAAAKELKLKSIGIIRGEETLPLNPTLKFARENGMLLHYVSREQYKQRDDDRFIASLRDQFEDFYQIPEGGTNLLAVKACAEYAETELSKTEFDYLCLPVGTGGTMAGIISGLPAHKRVVGFSVLKDGAFLNTEVKTWVHRFAKKNYDNWTLLTSYHHGGYAKVTDELLKFIGDMKFHYRLPLDHVYTGKLMWGLFKEIEKGNFPPGSTILAIHTGGLQGATRSA